MRRLAWTATVIGAVVSWGLVGPGTDQAGALEVGLNPDGAARVHLGAARPWQETPVARLQFNALLGYRSWELRMQPLASALQGPGGSIPLDRLQWSVGTAPSYADGPRHPLTPGTTILHRLDEPPYPLAVSWWFRPTWADRASTQPYSLTIAYTASADDVDTVNSAVIYPNPYDPATGQPLHILARWGGLPDDNAYTTGRPLDLYVGTLGPGRPGCGEPLRGDVLTSPRGTFDVKTPQAPPWVQYPWLEVTWDGRDANGQPVPPGRYCVSLGTWVRDDWGFDQPVTLASGIVTVGAVQGATSGSSLVVELRDRTSGDPVPAGTVSVRRQPEGVGREVSAGAGGRARLDGLPPGPYVVAAQAPGYRAAEADVTLPAAGPPGPAYVVLAMDPAASPRLSARVVPVAGGRPEVGDLVQVEILLQPPASGPAAALDRGEVEVELSRGLAALPATFEPSHPSDRVQATEPGRVTWAVRLPGPAREVSLRFVAAITPDAEGLAQVWVRAMGSFRTASSAPEDRVEAEPASASLELSRGTRMRAATVLGRVVDQAGRGVQGARVFSEEGTATTSGPSGWFSLAVAPGPHVLTAQPAGPPALRAVLGPGGARALVDARAGDVNPVILVLPDDAPTPPEGVRVAAAGQAEWSPDRPAVAGGGAVASASWGGARAHIALRAEASGVGVASASLVAGGHVLALGMAERDAALWVQGLYPPEETGLWGWPAAVRGPVALWHWSSGDEAVAAGLVAGQAGEPASTADGPAGPAVRAVGGARVGWGSERAWGRVAWVQEADGNWAPADRIGWEAGIRHWGSWYSLHAAAAAENMLADDRGLGPVTGEGLEVSAAGAGVTAPYGLLYRRRTGSLARAGSGASFSGLPQAGDALDAALALTGFSHQAAEGLDELHLQAGSMGWGLRRLGLRGAELVDSYASFGWLSDRGGQDEERAGEPSADGPGASTANRTLDELLAGTAARFPDRASPAPRWALRLGIVSAQSRPPATGMEPWWRPYVSAAGSWPLWRPTQTRRATVGASVLVLSGSPGAAGDEPRAPAGRAATWAEVAGEVAGGVAASFKATWAGRWEGQTLLPSPGLSLQAELRPGRPVRLAAGASATPSGLRWDQALLSFQSPSVGVEVRGTPGDVRMSASLTPAQRPWRFEAAGRWDVLPGGGSLQELEAGGTYLGPGWTGRVSLRVQPGGWSVEVAGDRGTTPQDEGQRRSAPAPGPVGVRPSIQVSYKRSWAGPTGLHTAVVRPQVRIPAGRQWGLFAEAVVAAQSTLDGRWQTGPLASGAAGVYAEPAFTFGTLRVEVGLRAGPGGAAPGWGPPGLFARLSGWSLPEREPIVHVPQPPGGKPAGHADVERDAWAGR